MWGKSWTHISGLLFVMKYIPRKEKIIIKSKYIWLWSILATNLYTIIDHFLFILPVPFLPHVVQICPCPDLPLDAVPKMFYLYKIFKIMIIIHQKSDLVQSLCSLKTLFYITMKISNENWYIWQYHTFQYYSK